MSRRLLPLLALLVAAVPASAADPMPAELKYVPPDAGFYVYLDVAAITDSKAGDAVAKSKLAETILKLNDANKLTAATLGDVKAVVYAIPSIFDATSVVKAVSVVTYRKKYDHEKLVAAIQAEAKKVKADVVVKDHLVRVTAASPFSPDNKLTTTHDLSDDTRVVSVSGLGDEYLKPGDATGVHTLALKANASAHALMGVNFNAFPDEIKKEDTQPFLRPFLPILLADSLVAAGTVSKDKLAVSVTVKAKNKADANEVEKSLDALRQLADTSMTAARKDLKTSAAKPKEVGELFDVLQAVLKDAKFGVSDSTATAAVSVPLDAPLGPFFDLITGGGASERSISSNNLKQLGLAMHNYEGAQITLPAPATLGKKGKKLLSWRVEMLPYIDQDDLYKKFKLDEAWDSEHNLKVLKDNPMPKVFAIPGTTNEADKKTHYQVFVGNGAMFDPAAQTKFADITDGTSNTIMVATAATAVGWTTPDDIEFDPKVGVAKLLLFRDGVSMVCFGDGSVRALSAKVSDKSLTAMVTRAGGEVVSDDE